jgi:hypothetical protein
MNRASGLKPDPQVLSFPAGLAGCLPNSSFKFLRKRLEG